LDFTRIRTRILVSLADGVGQAQETAQVEVALRFRLDALDLDAARRGMIGHRRGQAAHQRVEQMLRRIGALVGAEQHLRLAVVQDEAGGGGAVFRACAIELLER